MVAKKTLTDGTIKYRVCIDFRVLNALITDGSTAFIPTIESVFETIMKIKGIRYFSIIDLKSAYLKMTLDPADTWATTFHWNSQYYLDVGTIPTGMEDVQEIERNISNEANMPTKYSNTKMLLNATLEE
jgi:hypothetical protein